MRAFVTALAAAPATRTAAGMLAVRFANIGLGLVLAVVLTRVLGQSGYGIYAFAFATATVLALPVLLGVPTLVLREASRALGTGDGGGLLGIVAFALALVAAGILVLGLAGGLAVAGRLLPGLAGREGLAAATLGLVLATSLLAVGTAIVNATRRPLASTMPDSIVRPLLLIAGVLALSAAAGATPATAMAVHAGAATVALALVWTLAGRSLLTLRGAGRARVAWRPWMASLLPLALSAGVMTLNQRLDVVVLGLVRGPEEVALYAVAHQVATLILVGQTIANAILAPHLAHELRAGAIVSAQRRLSAAVFGASAFALLGLAAIVFAGRAALGLAFEPAYVAAFPALAVLAAGQTLSALMGPSALVLNMSGNERATLACSAAAAALNLVLNIPLVCAFGAVGAAIATSMSIALLQGLMFAMARRRTGLRTSLVDAMPRALAVLGLFRCRRNRSREA